ncbi:hypothetical protein BGZ61DRAFT_436951 [Ilyonectria robusta]|uniref:uncharacterized protein n=1 Tax=Ilyonectria robusta TaxID=1079257 RepID=UPI001E8EA4F5|nr:uncharacterized protein BGZ61DRAFT_436951 [Ilyonectria robusta]KAH8736748.1 hypothetical protein BGZ61DRAFT_436951 [Ilyonectria robusta]
MPPMPIIRYPCHRPPNIFLVARRRFPAACPCRISPALPILPCLQPDSTRPDLHIYVLLRTYRHSQTHCVETYIPPAYGSSPLLAPPCSRLSINLVPVKDM